MKKLAIFVAGITLFAQTQCATVRIKNASNHNVWARINNAKKSFSSAANFKKIEPGSSAFYNSDFDKIKIVTFVRVAGTKKITLPKNQIIKYVTDNFYKPFGIMNAIKGHMYIKRTSRHTQYGPPSIELTDTSSGKTVSSQIPLEPSGNATITVPNIETYTYNLGSNYIGSFTTEARITYFNWKNARRV